ncbi:MAG: hypothetical protein NT080_09740 [Spirochaetes bacterium]|nr:hypothetical protein [Spirochaetota bacterium]
MDELVARLSSELFWDVDPESVKPGEHAAWLVSRVLEGGCWEDWLAIRDTFGKDGLSRLEPRLRLGPKARNFLRVWLSL